jgi:hypothetical protein
MSFAQPDLVEAAVDLGLVDLGRQARAVPDVDLEQAGHAAQEVLADLDLRERAVLDEDPMGQEVQAAPTGQEVREDPVVHLEQKALMDLQDQVRVDLAVQAADQLDLPTGISHRK